MMTGYSPAKTGIYTFGHWNRESREFLPVDASDISPPAVWDIASLAGLKNAVINVPMTYPVHEVNGIMVSGLMTPTQVGDRHTLPLDFKPARSGSARLDGSTFSPLLGASADFQTNRFDFYIYDTTNDAVENYDGVSIVAHTGSSGDGGAPIEFELPVGVFSDWVKIGYTIRGNPGRAWCKVRVLPTGDIRRPFVAHFSRKLFATGDTDVAFTYPDTLADVLQKKFGYYFPSKFLDRAIVPEYTSDSVRWASYFYDYDDWDLFFYVFTQTDNIQHIDGVSSTTLRVYQEIDRFLTRIIEALPENTTLIVASDHGFKHHEWGFDLNRLFAQINLLNYNNENEIDYNRSLVFHNMWCLYLNRSLLNKGELNKRGITARPGETVEAAVIRYIEEAGRSISVGEQMVPFPITFKKMDSDAVGYAPDMVVDGSYSNYLVEFWNLKRPQSSVVRRLRSDEKWNHTRNGIFAIYGNGVRKGIQTPPAHIEDIASTILYRLGLPIAADMDGKVMTNVFDPGVLSSLQCFVVDDFAELSRGANPVKGDRESLEKKLRSLGYVH